MVLMDTKAQSCLYLRGWTNPDRERPLQGDPQGGSELPILESRSLADDDQSRHQVFSGDSDNPAGLGCARVFQKSGVRGEIRGEIRCQFIILALKDEPTPDSPKRRTDTGFPCGSPEAPAADYPNGGNCSRQMPW